MGKERMVHAESSGAATVAAGVALLVLGTNPDLTVDVLATLLNRTARRLDAAGQWHEPGLADRRDLLPLAVDPDGHNAKHGYGRLNATLACASAFDPVAAALIDIGEVDLAMVVAKAPRRRELEHLSRWLCTEMPRQESLRHGLAAVVRAIRLWLARPERFAHQPSGALLRQLVGVLRCLPRPPVGAPAISELNWLEELLRAKLQDTPAAAAFERSVLDWFAELRNAAVRGDGRTARSEVGVAAEAGLVVHTEADTDGGMVSGRW
jgi:hypothetical protein